MDNTISLKDIELNIEDMNNTNSVLTINHESDNQDNQRKNSNSILSVTSDQDFFIENRKNSNTSIRTVQSMPKYTECLAADKPFANISNKRMIDNITRAVSLQYMIQHSYKLLSRNMKAMASNF